MSLKNELSASKKLCPKFQMAVMGLPDNTDPDQPLFSAFVRASGNPVNGVQLNDIAGDIKTVHQLTLNNLKSLVDSDQVTYVQKSGATYPAAQKP